MFRFPVSRSLFAKYGMRVFTPLVALALAGCQNAQETAAREGQLAAQLLEAGNYPEAAKHVREAIAARDDVVDLHLLKAQIEIASGQLSSAFLSAKEGLALDRSNQQALALVANLGLRVGQTREATEAADQLLSLDPGSIQALQVKGLAALNQRKPDEALVFADKILTISPSDEGGVLMRSRVLALQGKPEEGVALIDKAMIVNVETPALLTMLLNIHLYTHDAAKIAQVYPRLIAKTPNDIALKLGYANFLYKTGRLAEARSLVTGILVQRLPAKIYDQAVALLSENETAPLDDASFARLAKEANSLALQPVLRHYLLAGQSGATAKLVALLPPSKQNELRPLIGRILLASGRVDEAQGIAEATLAKDAGSVDALLLSADIALRHRQTEKAWAQAQIALRNDPLNPAAYVILARTLLAKNEPVRARKIMEDGLQEIPQNQYLATTYTDFLINTGESGRAVSAARAFTRASPASVKGWARYGAVCRKLSAGCQDEAEEGRKKALTEYAIDDPPGTPPDRGLFGRL